MFISHIKKAAAVIVSAVIFAGCSFITNVDSLLSAPSLSAEQNEIYTALTSSVNSKKIKLIYPKSGENRSAVILSNIDSEPTAEAMVFYTIQNDSVESGNVRINILDKINGKWQSVYDHTGGGTDVERVSFATVGDSEKTSILVSFGTLYGTDNVFNAYSYENKKLTTTYTSNLSAYYVMDMDGDGYDEIVSINKNTPGSQGRVNLIDYTADGTLQQTSTVFLDPLTKDYKSITAGYIGTSTPALFIDGIRANGMATEIIYTVKDVLRNPIYTDFIIPIQDVTRPSEYPSIDINYDGVIEIPTLEAFPGYSNSDEKVYITNWNIFENYNIVKKYSSYFDYKQNYCFMLPSRWTGLVTAKYDLETGETVFYEFNSRLSNSTNELLRIRVRQRGNSDVDYSEYSLLRSTGTADYYYKVPSDKDESLILTETEILNNFYIIT